MCGDEQRGRRFVPSGRGERSATIRPVVITSVQRIAPSAWPPGWEDAEIVDSILVEEAPERIRRNKKVQEVYLGKPRHA